MYCDAARPQHNGGGRCRDERNHRPGQQSCYSRRPLLRRKCYHRRGTDDRVVGLVYIAALAPDADETTQTQQSNFPKTDIFSHVEVVDGRIWLRPEGTKYFCGDLSEQEQKLVWATQGAPKPDLFEAKVGGTAWKSKPSWYIVAKQDRTVHPDLERFFAKRMGATTFECDSSHVPMLSQPDFVLDVIREAADA